MRLADVASASKTPQRLSRKKNWSEKEEYFHGHFRSEVCAGLSQSPILGSALTVSEKMLSPSIHGMKYAAEEPGSSQTMSA